MIFRILVRKEIDLFINTHNSGENSIVDNFILVEEKIQDATIQASEPVSSVLVHKPISH